MTVDNPVNYAQQWADAAKRYYHTEPPPIVYKPCINCGKEVEEVWSTVHHAGVDYPQLHMTCYCSPSNNFTKSHTQPPLIDALKRSMRESVARAWNEANTEEIA